MVRSVNRRDSLVQCDVTRNQQDNMMLDKNGKKLSLLDKVVFDHGAVGVVSEFDVIGSRSFIAAWCQKREGGSIKLWGTSNAVSKII